MVERFVSVCRAPLTPVAFAGAVMALGGLAAQAAVYDEASAVGGEIPCPQPLPASSYLVFVDFDAREVPTIKAYDQGNSLITNATLAFTWQNENPPTPQRCPIRSETRSRAMRVRSSPTRSPPRPRPSSASRPRPASAG